MGHVLLKLVLLALIVAACATTGATRAEREARIAAAPTPEAKGQIYYEWACQRCHSLYAPKSYDAHEWRFYVKKYGRRARLSKEQEKLVYTYLEPNARGG